MGDADIQHIVFFLKAREKIVVAQTNNVLFGGIIVIQLLNVIIMKKKRLKMDELYKVLINFTSGKPVTRKRLLRIQDVTAELIQKALDEGCIIETSPSDIGEARYLMTLKGQSRL